MQRRKFFTAASLATAGMLLPVGCNSWVAQRVNSASDRQRLVVVFLRGAVDGLNIVIPHQEAEYYEARPTIAVPYPQEKNGGIDLDGFFSLHPKLQDLMPLWNNKNLAFVHASGSPVPERSHFQAQDYIENGTPGVKNTQDGWMNRLLAELRPDTPTQALNVGVTTPYILKGKMAIASLKPGMNSAAPIATDRPRVDKAFSSLYSGTDALSKAYQDGKKAREIVLADLKQEMISASRAAKSANAFIDDAAEVARLMVGNAKTQLAFMEIGGWDTHINQNPVFDRLLPSLGRGLAILAQGLEPIFSDTVIVVISEFGRTVKENGNKGTDHGYGNAIWLLGGGIRGGNVYGEWQGLDRSILYESRDLPVTTDFRAILAPILQQNLSVSSDSLNRIFPNYQPTNQIDFLA
ncbi:MAG TPA: DUF1501 domain-containing protein [Coleofasciculaceae cyanobacterium]|jgi:uncharacterized protein (DUF1501 family)